ncbi:hypothetical protein NTH44_003605 [Vibrio metoecus]
MLSLITEATELSNEIMINWDSEILPIQRSIISDIRNHFLTDPHTIGAFQFIGESVDSLSYLLGVIPAVVLNNKKVVIFCPELKLKKIKDQLDEIVSVSPIGISVTHRKDDVMADVLIMDYETLSERPLESIWRENAVYVFDEPQTLKSIVLESSIMKVDLRILLDVAKQTQALILQLSVVGKRSEPEFILNSQLRVYGESITKLLACLRDFTVMIGVAGDSQYHFPSILPRRVNNAVKDVLINTKAVKLQIDECLNIGANLGYLYELIRQSEHALRCFLKLSRHKWLEHDRINESFSLSSTVTDCSEILSTLFMGQNSAPLFMYSYLVRQDVQELVRSFNLLERFKFKHYKYPLRNEITVQVPVIPYGPKEELIEFWLIENLVTQFQKGQSTIVFFSNRKLMNKVRLGIEQLCTKEGVLLQMQGDANFDKQIVNHKRALGLNLHSVLLASTETKKQLVESNCLFNTVVFLGVPFDAPYKIEMQVLLSQYTQNENHFELVSLPRALNTMSEIICNLLSNEENAEIVLLDQRIKNGASYANHICRYLAENHNCIMN